MWCPKCNEQYEDGFTVCAKCGAKLIEYTPIVSPDDADSVIFDYDESEDKIQTSEGESEIRLPEANNGGDMLFDAKPELLITVIGEDEALRIMQLLEDNLIPSLKKAAESAGPEPESDYEDFSEIDEEGYFDGSEDEFSGVQDGFGETAESDENIAEFSALCDEALETGGLFDIYVPEAAFRDALRIVVEDEQAGSDEKDRAEHAGQPEEEKEKKTARKGFSLFSKLKKEDKNPQKD